MYDSICRAAPAWPSVSLVAGLTLILVSVSSAVRLVTSVQVPGLSIASHVMASPTSPRPLAAASPVPPAPIQTPPPMSVAPATPPAPPAQVQEVRTALSVLSPAS